MWINEHVATQVVYLLNRVVLASVFGIVGLSQIAFSTTYGPSRAKQLRRHGVTAVHSPLGVTAETTVANARRSRGRRGGAMKASRVHHVTLALADSGWRWHPNWIAWAAAVLEVLAAILILGGLYTRAASAVCAMVLLATFFFTFDSLPRISMDSLEFNTVHLVSAQITAFVMAIGLVLTGGGDHSLDTVWLGRRRR